jgi:sec-independent protein translocase protein TatB
MIDFGFDKLALIGAVALIVIGPEKLPKVARTVGHLVGKAQRYVADVRAEVNRSIELDELKKMKSQFEDAARNVEQTVHSTVSEASSSFDKEWSSIGSSLDGSDSAAGNASEPLPTPPPEYKHPGKKWRLKRGAMPQWYRQRHGIRAKAQSGAARVARFRPSGVKVPR